MKETNVHAKSVTGTSRAVMIVAYLAVLVETKPMSCLKRKGRSFAKILDAQRDVHITSTQLKIHTILTPYH